MIQDYNKEEIIESLQSKDKVYLYFHTEGCGSCQITLSKIEEISNTQKNKAFSIFQGVNPQLEKYLGVDFFPTLVVVENQQATYLCSGIKQINNYLANGKSNQ